MEGEEGIDPQKSQVKCISISEVSNLGGLHRQGWVWVDDGEESGMQPGKLAGVRRGGQQNGEKKSQCQTHNKLFHGGGLR